MSNNDDDFLAAMGGVKPLQADKRVSLKKSVLDKAAYNARRQAAEQAPSTVSDPLSESEVRQLDPLAVLEYRRPGVQHGVYKQLRLGRYQIDARLDLHQMTVQQARRAVYEFVGDCLKHDIRCALIAHGKGEGRKNPAVLKSHLAHWLPQVDSVLAFHSAQNHHGGLGACYILIKKSQHKRLENLEMHQKRH